VKSAPARKWPAKPSSSATDRWMLHHHVRVATYRCRSPTEIEAAGLSARASGSGAVRSSTKNTAGFRCLPRTPLSRAALWSDHGGARRKPRGLSHQVPVHLHHADGRLAEITAFGGAGLRSFCGALGRRLGNPRNGDEHNPAAPSMSLPWPGQCISPCRPGGNSE
jgi:hypothetical protein